MLLMFLWRARSVTRSSHWQKAAAHCSLWSVTWLSWTTCIGLVWAPFSDFFKDPWKLSRYSNLIVNKYLSRCNNVTVNKYTTRHSDIRIDEDVLPTKCAKIVMQLFTPGIEYHGTEDQSLEKLTAIFGLRIRLQIPVQGKSKIYHVMLFSLSY